ncbi:MAG: hemerythrin domain-containing protein [Alphaproteobacteria bacterium]
MAEVMRILRQDHSNMARLLDLLDRQLEAFDAGKPVDYEIVEGVVDYYHSYPDLCHHPLEDLVLGRLRRRDGTAARDFDKLEGDHAELASLTDKFAALVHQVVSEAQVPRNWFGRVAHEFVETNRRHMAMEDKYFFPVAEKVLTDEDWDELDARVADMEDPLFSKNLAKRFENLRTEILSLERSEP